jgi:hypothetical protein
VAVLLRASAYSAKAWIGACDQNTPESLKERKRAFSRGNPIHFGETSHCAKSVNPVETRFCGRRERISWKRHGLCEVGIGKRVTPQNVTVQPDFDLQ